MVLGHKYLRGDEEKSIIEDMGLNKSLKLKNSNQFHKKVTLVQTIYLVVS